MKRTIPFLTIFILSLASLHAAVPSRIVYQGRLSKSGVSVAGTHTFVARLLKGSDSSQLWASGNIPLTLPASGDFTLTLDSITGVDWINDAPKLEITVDGEKLSPDSAFATNAYAFVAQKVDANGVDAAALQAGAVTDAKINASGISPTKILVSTSAGVLLNAWSTPSGGINASVIIGTVTTGTAHRDSHKLAGADPLTGIDRTQLLGTAIVSSLGTTQILQPASSVPGIAFKGGAGSNSKILQFFDSGILGDFVSTTTERGYFDKDANFFLGRNFLLTGSLGIGTAAPAKNLDILGTAQVSSTTLLATAGGSVGIGTSSPAKTLDVAGTAQVSNTTLLAVSGGQVGVGTASPSKTLDVAGTVQVSSSAFLAVSGGNVGIGTSSPGSKLDVAGSFAANSGVVSTFTASSLNFNAGSVISGLNPSADSVTALGSPGAKFAHIYVDTITATYGIENFPAFAAYNSGTQVISNNNLTTVVFPSEDYDSNGDFAANTFTATIGGYYHFNACVEVVPMDKDDVWGIYLLKGGVKSFLGNKTTGIDSNASLCISVDAQVTSGSAYTIGIQRMVGTLSNTLGTSNKISMWFNGHRFK